MLLYKKELTSCVWGFGLGVWGSGFGVHMGVGVSRLIFCRRASILAAGGL